MFSDAAGEFAVPVAVLMAVSYVETAWIDHGAVPSFANGCGLMHLQENDDNTSLALAAQQLGVPTAALKLNTRENIRGGAAYLRHLYRATYPDDSALSRAADLGRWYQPVARYLQSDVASVRRNYADAVFNTIGRGRVVSVAGGTLSMGPARVLAIDRGPLENIRPSHDNGDWCATRATEGGVWSELGSTSRAIHLVSPGLLIGLLVDDAVLHHEADASHDGDVLGRIVGYRDDVGMLAGFNRPKRILNAKERRGFKRGSADGDQRRHAAFDH